MIGVGSVVSGYRVQRILGSGGMGTVYAVADPELPRLDALKVMPAEFSADTDFRKRFLREADIAATLDHPNIVSVYDRGETPEGQLWIAMQLVDGTYADEALRAGTMTPARAVHIVTAVGEALDYAHGRHVLHRDIKPANFLLTGPVGPDERALLGDFGIARSADDAGITATNAVMTTMAYAAPEVLEGGRVDYRADLYSLGCALYHLLTGQTPYADTPGMAAQAMAHLRRPVPRPTAVAPGLSPEFDAVIATAMAKDPAQRFRSGRELAQAAAAALRAQSTPARGYTAPGIPPEQSWPGVVQADLSSDPERPKSRGKLIAALAGTVVLVGGGMTAVSLMGDSESDPTPPTPATATAAAPEAPTVAPEALPELLLSDAQVSAVLGREAKQVKELTGFANDNARSGQECLALAYPMQERVYANSAASTGFAQINGVQGPGGDYSTVQAVVPFPTAALAQSFIDRQAALWPGCAYKTVEIRGTPPAPDTTWQLGASNYEDGMLTAVKTAADGSGSCQRALTAAGTVVVDVTTCMPSGLGDQGATIARQIAEKVPL